MRATWADSTDPVVEVAEPDRIDSEVGTDSAVEVAEPDRIGSEAGTAVVEGIDPAGWVAVFAGNAEYSAEAVGTDPAAKFAGRGHEVAVGVAVRSIHGVVAVAVSEPHFDSADTFDNTIANTAEHTPSLPHTLDNCS